MGTSDTPAADSARLGTPRGRRILRSTAAAVLITFGVVLAPVALTATTAQTILRDSDRFVETFAPLAENPAIQREVTAQVAIAIDDAIDTPTLARELIGGLQTLEMPAVVSGRLALLEAPLAAGMQSLVHDVVERFVSSPAFAETWRGALRVAHTGINATIAGTDGAVLVVDGPTVAVDLAPIITAVRGELVDRGITLASAIPEGVGPQIAVAEVEGLTQVRMIIVGLDIANAWLPVLVAVLLVAGILLAMSWRRAIFATGVALLAIGLVLGAGLGIGRMFATGVAAISADAVGALFDAAAHQVSAGVAALTTLGALMALAAWWAGPSRPARALRAGVTDTAARLPLPTSFRPIGAAVRGASPVLAGVLVAAMAVVLTLVRPFTPELVLTTGAVALLLLVVAVVLRAQKEPETAATPAPVP